MPVLVDIYVLRSGSRLLAANWYLVALALWEYGCSGIGRPPGTRAECCAGPFTRPEGFQSMELENLPWRPRTWMLTGDWLPYLMTALMHRGAHG